MSDKLPIKFLQGVVWTAEIQMPADLNSDTEDSFGVVLVITRHNWTTGVRTEYSSAGIWGFEADTDMPYVLENAKMEFQTLKEEYPGVFDHIVIDAATPARFK